MKVLPKPIGNPLLGSLILFIWIVGMSFVFEEYLYKLDYFGHPKRDINGVYSFTSEIYLDRYSYFVALICGVSLIIFILFRPMPNGYESYCTDDTI